MPGAFLSVIEKATDRLSRLAAPRGGGNDPNEIHTSGPPRKSALADPTWVLSALRFRDKPWGLSYDVLRVMAMRNSVISAIVQTRINQVGAFWKPAHTKRDGKGFVVRHRDVDHTLTKQEEKFVKRAEDFISRCGDIERPRDRFHTFMKKWLRDSLVLDQGCFELVRDRKDRVREFFAVDGGSIRLVLDVPSGMVESYVQVIRGQPVTTYQQGDLAFCIRNPRADLMVAGYGRSELEDLINVVTAHLFAEEYNRRFFTHGATPKGIMFIEGGDITQDMMFAFQREWQANLAGVIGAHKVPFMALPNGKPNFVNMQSSNREMEFGRWMDYLINIACAVYQIDPAEVNFPNRGGGTGGDQPLISGGTAGEADRLKHSKDKGLVPLLEFAAESITENILWEMDGRGGAGEDFMFEFDGVNAKDRSDEVNVEKTEVEYLYTVNEMRAKHDEPPIDGGDIILNPTYTQALRDKQMADQQTQQSAADTGDVNTMPAQEPDDEELRQALVEIEVLPPFTHAQS